MSNALLVTGVVGLDHIITSGCERSDLLGGSVPFAALAAARLYKPVNSYAAVGRDFPDEYIRMLESQGVSTSYWEYLQGKTFRWCGRYEDNMNHRETVSRELNVLDGWNPSVPVVLKKPQVLVLASATSSMHVKILEQCDESCLILADTIDHWIVNEREETDEIVRRSDIFVLNESEAYLYSGCRNLMQSGEFLLDLGARFVIIKLGEYGSILFHRKEDGSLESFRCGAWPLRTVVDPTGAGDAFLGALAGYLAKLEINEIGFSDIKTGMAYGAVAASYVCEDFSSLALERVEDDGFFQRFALFHRLTSW